ncbi:MAG: hypothetical protein ACRDVZ_09425, partial [Jiangellaceae bacterium]
DLVSAASRSPREHAERLLAAPTAPTRRKNRGELTNLLYAAGSERFTPEWMQMIWSLEAGVPVPIDYREPDGTTRHMLIDNPELYDDSIDVWCWKTGDYRRLELSRIVPRES